MLESQLYSALENMVGVRKYSKKKQIPQVVLVKLLLKKKRKKNKQTKTHIYMIASSLF